jgi:hypothetical protein
MKLLRSTLAQNVADGSKLSSSSANGGAVFIGDDSVGEVSESEIVENAAREALNYPTGGAFYVTNGARLVLTTSKVNHNVADGGGGGYSHNPAGGAIYLYLSEGEIVNCDLLKNIVRGGKFANAGTNPKSTCLSHSLTGHTLWLLHYTRFASVRPFDPRLSRFRVCSVVETKDEPLVGQPEPSRGRR